MDFASKISLTCFAASYGIGLVNELLRLVMPHRFVRWLATAACLAGLFAQTLFLAARGVAQLRLPIATQFDSLIAVSWLLGLIYLYLLLRERRLGAGLFILPVLLGILLFAGRLADPGHGTADGGMQVIAVSHGILLLVGTVASVVAATAAAMYLVKMQQLKSSVARAAVRLPSLERLDRVNLVAVYVAWPMLTVGLAMGFLVRPLRWTDPKIVMALIAWAIFTLLANYRIRPEHRGRPIALLTIAATIIWMIGVLGDPLFGTEHQSAGKRAGDPPAVSPPRANPGATP